MRARHWEGLIRLTGKDFAPPYENPKLRLEELLALNLHEFAGDVEDICDQVLTHTHTHARSLFLSVHLFLHLALIDSLTHSPTFSLSLTLSHPPSLCNSFT